MAVRLVKGVERELDRLSGQLVQEIVATERAFAPVDTGFLAGSISGRKVGPCHYVVSTNAVGRNGFAYPLHIEFGQPIVASKGKTLHFIAHGKEVFAKSTAPSAQSHFARKTIAAYGGKYVGK